jgi:dUTPase
MTKVGLVTSDERITYYGFRRFSINKVLERSGLDAAKKHAGHQGGSNAVMDSYYDYTGKVDTVGANTGEDEFNMEDQQDTLADTR